MVNLLLILEDALYTTLERRAALANFDSAAAYASHLLDESLAGIKHTPPEAEPEPIQPEPMRPNLLFYRENNQPAPIQPKPMPTARRKPGRKPRNP